jgi:hypothetical protein
MGLPQTPEKSGSDAERWLPSCASADDERRAAAEATAKIHVRVMEFSRSSTGPRPLGSQRPWQIRIEGYTNFRGFQERENARLSRPLRGMTYSLAQCETLAPGQTQGGGCSHAGARARVRRACDPIRRSQLRPAKIDFWLQKSGAGQSRANQKYGPLRRPSCPTVRTRVRGPSGLPPIAGMSLHRHEQRVRARRRLSHRSRRCSHSITSSAIASRFGGTTRPSAFAVLRLMTNSKFVARDCRHFWGCLKYLKSGGAWSFLAGISMPSALKK